MSGWLRVVGLGPGPQHWITPEVSQVLEQADALVGYHRYLERLVPDARHERFGSDNGDELARARHALALCQQGRRVAVISSGDPGVFAMAAAIFEAIERGPSELRALDVQVLPGVTAMLAAAARLGAPLGNDFCAVNLSDNLKPWSIIEQRLLHAARADFVICLYNPASRARPRQVHDAFALLARERAPETVVVFAKAIGRSDEEITIRSLESADPAFCDMRTLLLIGASTTRCITRPGTPWVYSPRRLGDKP